MKKIAFLGLMFFIIFSQIFADENMNKFENIYFSWQLFYYQENNKKINFININPLFFNNNFLSNNYVYISQDIRYQNGSSQNNRNIRANSQMKDVGGFLLCTGVVITGWSVWSATNSQERNTNQDIWKDTWNRQEEMKNFNQRIYK
jgi:hypothetical protein